MPIKKILIVDDSPTERHALSELLVKSGFNVVTAESGEEAITKSKSEMPDLILMDVVMPGMNGYKGQETDKVWGMRQGANDYLVKPIDPKVLLEKIAALG